MPLTQTPHFENYTAKLKREIKEVEDFRDKCKCMATAEALGKIHYKLTAQLGEVIINKRRAAFM